ncbi:Gly-Xaa carboxypeptidase [Capronia epimyces CBS 606.96]|uniref:Gly-Xaa carboxypeptidase n=1 Tax=Capronia epimyces CBS 606.96 TaxID=1182542 RepID=W9Y298_9EURO|nr:Gly-Xaa carboxypeptidase [Capronia epimyces CBS 606.96]EXJ86628.1 Gly-Xaa carboxypeptidase [Capronia epimyces CBS 606.96]
MEELIASDDFKNQSIAHLSGAVQVRTESFDDLGPVGQDARWDVFYDFAAYLKTTYPLVHSTFQLDRVNTHGLVYTWNGSNPTLRPTLLLAHQDTVPVPEATLNQWEYPPWSGFFDGKYIWGRGAADCKSQLTAILDAAEQLIAHGFEPQRTLILAFGFDEEASGPHGAGHLAPFLLDRYGKDSIAVLVDEGSTLQTKWGTFFALPGVSEKGYIDLEIVVRTPGGHSSVPPAHTGIGILSEIITILEANVFEPRLYNQNPYLGQLQCGARYSPKFPPKLKALLKSRPRHFLSSDAGDTLTNTKRKTIRDPLAEEAAKDSLYTRYLVQTSRAVDIIAGGVKINALPEEVSVKVNHRVNIGDKPSDVLDQVIALTEPVAHKYNLTLESLPFNSSSPKLENSITISPLKGVLNPAPVTPTEVDPISPYTIIAGTTRALYGEDVIVAPGIMTGNTDTRYFWDLTQHIFRYGVGFDADAITSGVHTVNEKQSIAGHLRGTKWMSDFIRNMDEAELP